MMDEKIRVGITHGDFNGIGYEVIVKALAADGITELMTPWCSATDGCSTAPARKRAYSSRDLILFPRPRMRKMARSILWISAFRTSVSLPGQPTAAASGAAAVKALEEAVSAVSENDIDVLVTAPISKEAVQSDSFCFPGHTEFLNARAGGGVQGADDTLRRPAPGCTRHYASRHR